MNSFKHALAHVPIDQGLGQPCEEGLPVDETAVGGHLQESNVLVPSSKRLRDDQVMGLEPTLHPSAGTAAVRGRVAPILELGAGFDPEFTGRDNVVMNAAIFGLTQAETSARLPKIVEFADIGDFIDQPVKTYSSGMFMRLAFAIIAHVDADILVIDEALSVGDAYFAQKCMRFLREFHERGTILFVSHSIDAVTSLCRRAIWLDHGQVMLDGPAKEVCEAYFGKLYGKAGTPDSVKEEKVAASVNAGNGDAGEPASVLSQEAPVPRYQMIEAFGFNSSSASFGDGRAQVTGLEIQDSSGRPLQLVKGGELITLTVEATCKDDIESPILGFIIKDKLGQALIGDNTYLEYWNRPERARAGQKLKAVFRFRLPLFDSGHYSVCGAVASGTMQEHVHHHWLHDALIFTVNASQAKGVLVGLPMESIKLKVVD